MRGGFLGRRAAAGGGTGASAGNFYSYNITTVDGGSFISCEEIELRATVGGATITGGSIRSGTATASTTNFGSATSAFSLISSSLDGGWVANATTGTLQWADTSTVDVVGVSITSRSSEATRAPKDFTIQWSDDGSSWTTVLTVTGETTWDNAFYDDRTYTWASVGAKKYWRINVTANNGHGSLMGFQSIRFHISGGGIISAVARSVLVTSTLGYFPLSNQLEKVFDGGTGGWTSASSGVTAGRVVFHMPPSVTVAQVTWKSRSGEGARAPKNFTLESASYLTSWTNRGTFNETGWGSQETRAFTLS